MSAYITLETQFDDQECLVNSLMDIGMSPVSYTEPTELQGWGSRKSKRKAEVIVPKASFHGYADIGFARNEKGKFQTIIDDMETRKLDQDRLARTYAEKKALSLAAAKGMKLARREVNQTTNTTRLIFQTAGTR